MPVETTFICDGCDRRLTKRRDDALPANWAEAHIRVSDLTNWVSGGTSAITVIPILCPQCQIVLAERVNPRKWAREQPALPEPPASLMDGGEVL